MFDFIQHFAQNIATFSVFGMLLYEKNYYLCMINYGL